MLLNFRSPAAYAVYTFIPDPVVKFLIAFTKGPHIDKIFEYLCFRVSFP